MKYPLFFRELKTSASLAIPLIFTQLFDMSLGLVDTLVAGRLGADAIAALAVANGLFWAVVCIAGGLLAGLDTYIAQASGDRNQSLTDRLLAQGLWLGLFASILTICVVLGLVYSYSHAGFSEQLMASIWQYTLWVLPTAPLVLMMSVFQRYWQSQSYVKPFTVLLIALNILNYALNVALTEGAFGYEGLAMGVNGIAFSTTLSRVIAFSCVVIGSIWAWKKQGRGAFSLQPDRVWLGKLLALGLPSVGHLASDVFAFNVLTFFAASLGAISVAANQIMFMITCITVMIPLGISHAAGIRVGQCLGANQAQFAISIARFNVAFSAVFLSIIGVLLSVYARDIAGVFTSDPALVAETTPLIQLCGFFQVIDGLQILYASFLRAWGEVRRVFQMSLVAHYGVGLPLALLCCFYFDYEVFGLWIGITVGLAAALAFNAVIWKQTRKAFPNGSVSVAPQVS